MNPARLPFITVVDRIDAQAVAVATVILWCAALGFFACRLLPQLPDAPLPTFDVGEALLLAVAALCFQLSALRVGLDHLARIWRASAEPMAECCENPTRWRVFGWIGAASWLAAVAVGVPAAAGLWLADSTDLIFALVIVLIPAVQCTGAAVVGPILTHVIQERETARAVRRAVLDVGRAARDGA